MFRLGLARPGRNIRVSGRNIRVGYTDVPAGSCQTQAQKVKDSPVTTAPADWSTDT